jgi:hypothetical protein
VIADNRFEKVNNMFIYSREGVGGDALLIYGKNERANLTPEQRKAVKAFATAIKALRKRK